MNVTEALDKLNQAGGDLKGLSGNELYEVYRALQGSFGHGDKLRDIRDYVETHQTVLADAELRSKLQDVNLKRAENIAEVKDVYEATSLFSDRPFRPEITSDAVKAVRNYSDMPSANPNDYEDLIDLMGDIKSNVATNKTTLDPVDRTFLDGYLKEVQKEAEDFYKVHGVLNVDLREEDVAKNYEAASRISKVAVTTTENKKTAKEIANLLDSLEISEIESDLLDDLKAEEYRQDMEKLASEEAVQKCSVHKGYDKLDKEKQAEVFLKAKQEALEDNVRSTLLSQAAMITQKSLEVGADSFDVAKKAFEQSVNDAIDLAKAGKAKGKKAIKIAKSVALTSLFTTKDKLSAISKRVATKTGFSKLRENVAKIDADFKKKYPKTAHAMSIIGKAAVKGGAVVAGHAVGVGGLVSAGFAVQGTVKAINEMKLQYRNDAEYKGKSFGKYMRDHKKDTLKVVTQGVTAGILAGIGVNSTVFAFGGQELMSGLMSNQKFVRGASSAGLGIVTGIANFSKAKNKKSKKVALASTIAAVGVSGLAMFLPEGTVKEMWGKIGSWFKGGNDGQAAEALNQAVASKSSFVDQYGLKNPYLSENDGTQVPFKSQAMLQEERNRMFEELQASKTTGFSGAEREDFYSDSQWNRINNRITGFFIDGDGEDKLDHYKFMIESGYVEGIPENMSAETYIYKMRQLILMAPVAHKDTIELMLKDINCDTTILTEEQRKQVWDALKLINDKGEYLGKHIGVTDNITTSIKEETDCTELNYKLRYTQGEKIVDDIEHKKIDVQADITKIDRQDVTLEVDNNFAEEEPLVAPVVKEVEAPVEAQPEPRDFKLEGVYKDVNAAVNDMINNGILPDGQGGYVDYGTREAAIEHLKVEEGEYLRTGQRVMDSGLGRKVPEGEIRGKSLENALRNGEAFIGFDANGQMQTNFELGTEFSHHLAEDGILDKNTIDLHNKALEGKVKHGFMDQNTADGLRIVNKANGTVQSMPQGRGGR